MRDGLYLLVFALGLGGLAVPARALAQAAPRSAGGLVVPSTPVAARVSRGMRLRSHVDGTLSAGATRTWVGPPIPAYVALAHGTLELFLLDVVPQGHFAVYRDPYGAGSCTLYDSANCEMRAALYDPDGREVWNVRLNDFLSRPDHLEIQDARLGDDGTLYVNEACQSYSREAGGRCSSLLAVDPLMRRVIWRTRALISNGQFLVRGAWIFCGYGFTDEKDFVSIVRRRDGRVMQRVEVGSMPSAFTLEASSPGGALDLLRVELSQGDLTFSVRGLGGSAPRLVQLRAPAPVGPVISNLPPPP